MSKRNSMIDILKLLFTIVVLVNHLNGLFLPEENKSLFMHLGFLGVEFFFIVSGYFMFDKVEKLEHRVVHSEYVKFIFHKISIFFPYYIVAFTLGFIVAHYPDKFLSKMILRDLLMSVMSILQLEMAGFKTYQVLGPSWYLSAMILGMMVIFPVAFKLRESFSKIVAPIIAVACYGFLSLNIGKLATITQICGGSVQWHAEGFWRHYAGVRMF